MKKLFIFLIVFFIAATIFSRIYKNSIYKTSSTQDISQFTVTPEYDAAISEALLKQDLDTVKSLVQNKQQANAETSFGQPYFFGVFAKDFLQEDSSFEKAKKIFEHYLSKGADINKKDKFRSSMLILAVNADELPLVKYLISKGANADIKGNIWEQECNIFSFVQSEEMASFILSKTSKNLNDPSFLNEVMQCEDLYSSFPIEYVIKSGAAFDPENQQIKNAVYWAAGRGDHAIIQSFLNRKGDINGQFTWGSLGAAAASGGKTATIDFLISKGFDYKKNETQMLISAARNRQIETIKYLLRRGADINGRDEEGNTALIQTFDPETAEFLISQGADVKLKNKHGIDALYKNSLQARLDIVKVLVNAGAVDNWKSRHMTSVFNETLLNASMHFDVIEYYISKGVNLNQEGAFQDGTPLGYASGSSTTDKKVFPLLLNAGAKPNILSNGFSPLSLIIRNSGYNGFDSIKLLVSKGADVNLKNKDGSTPLILALDNYPQPHGPLIEYLITQGADAGVKDKKGKTALDHAAAVYGDNSGEAIKIIAKTGKFNKDDYTTALCEARSLKAIDALVELGADVNGNKNCNPVHELGRLTVGTTTSEDFERHLVSKGAKPKYTVAAQPIKSDPYYYDDSEWATYP
ncbi:ankyrin repeat protein [Elusimicrobium posterum]|uniref:ankyrin repeat domain-containing protein n=1 Tax=Elusimicrobium posterum TaxID=3116653 RepID=UPI003C718672